MLKILFTKINLHLENLLSFPGCDVKTLNTRKTIWLATFFGFLFLFPLTCTLAVMQPTFFGVYYNYYLTIDFLAAVILIPYLKKYFNLFCIIDITLRVLITFFFILLLGGITNAFAMLFIGLTFVFLTIPLRIIWFTIGLSGLYSALTIIVGILGPVVKLPDEKMINNDIRINLPLQILYLPHHWHCISWLHL